jgi:hypothetical protein
MEERRFDELSRALGRGASRRTVLKGILGAAFGGVLAAAGVRAPRLAEAAAPLCNGVPYTPGLQCCAPAGVQTLYPIADLDLCPDRVPHPGHVPEFNGCGPAKGFSHFIIPNKIGPSRNIDFTQACNNHDICYDTCNSAKSGCDEAFLLDMSTACAAAYPGRGTYDRYMRNACVADSTLYFYAVSQTDAGTDAYESAQKLACDCCSVCQECGGTSDGRCCGGTCYDACPEGKERDPQTCECKCASSCPPGQHQDPETCACEDLCEGVTCSECHTCNPDSGDCVEANDLTACGSGQVCCGGVCKDDCGCPPSRVLCNGVCCDQNEICVDGVCGPSTGCATACGPDEICCNLFGILDDEGYTETWVCKKTSEYKICPVSPLSSSPGTRDDYICCPIDLECCGGTGGIYEICGGPSNGLCCPAGTSECGESSDDGLFCCDFDWDHGSCRYNTDTQSYYCDPA